jgi:hypothetical protein
MTQLLGIELFRQSRINDKPDYRITFNDGEEVYEINSPQELVDALYSVDEGRVDTPYGWFLLILGNDPNGEELIADWSFTRDVNEQKQSRSDWFSGHSSFREKWMDNVANACEYKREVLVRKTGREIGLDLETYKATGEMNLILSHWRK